jgi:hypothetical protein
MWSMVATTTMQLRPTMTMTMIQCRPLRPIGDRKIKIKHNITIIKMPI